MGIYYATLPVAFEADSDEDAARLAQTALDGITCYRRGGARVRPARRVLLRRLSSADDTYFNFYDVGEGGDVTAEAADREYPDEYCIVDAPADLMERAGRVHSEFWSFQDELHRLFEARAEELQRAEIETEPHPFAPAKRYPLSCESCGFSKSLHPDAS